MLIEITNYYARPGQSDNVLAQRRHASEVRRRLGLAPGAIYTKLEGAGPDVRWECRFESRDEYERDMATRAASAEFAQARADMHQLIEKFERHLQQPAA